MTTREGMLRAAEVCRKEYDSYIGRNLSQVAIRGALLILGEKINAEAERLPAEGRDAVLDAYVAELERRALEQKEWEAHPKCEDNGVGDAMLVIVNELRALKNSPQGEQIAAGQVVDSLTSFEKSPAPAATVGIDLPWMIVHDGDSYGMLQSPTNRIFGIEELIDGEWRTPLDNEGLCQFFIDCIAYKPASVALVGTPAATPRTDALNDYQLRDHCERQERELAAAKEGE